MPSTADSKNTTPAAKWAIKRNMEPRRTPVKIYVIDVAVLPSLTAR